MSKLLTCLARAELAQTRAVQPAVPVLAQIVAKGDMVNEMFLVLEGQVRWCLQHRTLAMAMAAPLQLGGSTQLLLLRFCIVQAVVTTGNALPQHVGGPGAGTGTSRRALSTAALKRSKTAASQSQAGAQLRRSTGGVLQPGPHLLERQGSQCSVGSAGSDPPDRISAAGDPPHLFARSSSMGGDGDDLRRSESGLSVDTSFAGSAASSVFGPALLPGATAAHQDAAQLVAGSCFGQTSFLADLPSNASVWSTTLIKVLVISRSCYLELLKTYPQQTRKLLENVERHAEEVRPFAT